MPLSTPSKDVLNTGWSPTPVSNHVNQGGVSTGDNPQNVTFEVLMSQLPQHPPGLPQLTVVVGQNGPGPATVTITLLQWDPTKQVDTVIATRTFSAMNVSGTYPTNPENNPLPTADEAKLITDYTNLHVQVMATAGTVLVTCCPNNPLPSTLYAKLSNVSGCACLDGAEVTLAWDGVTSWVGDLAACGTNYHFDLGCVGNSCTGMQLRVSNIGSGDAGVKNAVAGCSCNPPSFTFQGFSGVTGCNGTFNVTVTATP